VPRCLIPYSANASFSNRQRIGEQPCASVPTVARYPDTSGRAQIPCEALRRVGSHFGELYPVDIRGGVLAPGREPFRIPKRKLRRLPAIRKTFRHCSSRSSAISTWASWAYRFDADRFGRGASWSALGCYATLHRVQVHIHEVRSSQSGKFVQDCRAELKREGQSSAMTIVRTWLAPARRLWSGDVSPNYAGAAPKFLESLGLRHSEDFDAQRLIYLCLLCLPHHARAISARGADPTSRAPALMMQQPGDHECSSRLDSRSACS